MVYENILLASSNILALIPIINSNNFIFKKLLLVLMFFSFLHHLTETNQVDHNLEGIYVPFFSYYADILRYIDIFLAYLTFLFIIIEIGLINSFKFIYNNLFFLLIAIYCCYLCDYVIKESIYYFYLHLLWHILIYYILYKLTFLL